ncbi:MAG: hybrid sensor histidine kinase/response regulator [Opitutaceae bacterium]
MPPHSASASTSSKRTSRRGASASKAKRGAPAWPSSQAPKQPGENSETTRTLVAILDSNGNLTGCTAALEKVLLRSRDSLAGTSFFDLIQSPGRTEVQMGFQRLLTGHPPADLHAGLIRGDRTVVWMMLRAALSPQKTAILLEASLMESPMSPPTSREVLPAHLVLNEIEEGVLIADATQAELPVIDVNPGFSQLSGYTRAETLGRAIHFLADGNTNRRLLDATIATALGGSRASAELGLSRKDGSPLWIRLTLIPLRDAAGKVERVLAIHLDVSERRIVFDALREKHVALTGALESLQKTKEAIVQRERMHALGKMASGIVHDFNNLLAPILGFTELLLTFPSMIEDTAKVSTYLQKIRTAATDGAAVVSRLREFYRSREEAEEPEEFSPQHAIEEILDLTRHRWLNEAQAQGHEIKVDVDLQQTSRVMGVVAEIRQALTNLVLNAADAMPEGGTLSVRTCGVGNWVCIQISDTGTGMTPETRMRCFEPFFTTKGKSGTGLGLAIVFGIVERHRGRLDLQSEPGRGTTFTIWLPASTDGANKGVMLNSASKDTNVRPLHILLVDDEDLFLEVVSENLLGMGHSVDCFTDPTAALETFYKQRYDLVITDRAMPGMTGDQLAMRVREYQPSLPVVLLTGFGSIIKQSGEQPPNISEVLPKPLSQQMLREMLVRYGGSSGEACA